METTGGLSGSKERLVAAVGQGCKTGASKSEARDANMFQLLLSTPPPTKKRLQSLWCRV